MWISVMRSSFTNRGQPRAAGVQVDVMVGGANGLRQLPGDALGDAAIVSTWARRATLSPFLAVRYPLIRADGSSPTADARDPILPDPLKSPGPDDTLTHVPLIGPRPTWMP